MGEQHEPPRGSIRGAAQAMKLARRERYFRRAIVYETAWTAKSAQRPL